MGLHRYVMEGVSKEVPDPKLSFLVGMLLVIFIVLVATTIFLCMYHWSKVLREYREQQMASSIVENMTHNNNAEEEGDKQKFIIFVESMPYKAPLVYMPGHAMPTFVAMPSPFLHSHRGLPPVLIVPSTTHEDKLMLTAIGTS